MNILIGISGGISAYKICDLVRAFVKDGHEVKTVVTENAKYFVTPTTLETLSKNRCYSELFENSKDVDHVSLGKWADLMILAPATANIIGKIASGICDDLLSTLMIACDKPCYIFPSMNTNMYTHPAVQDNITKLRDWGYVVYEPMEGELACGDTGKGRLPDISLIHDMVISEMERVDINSVLQNKNITITAGPTRAYIDPVRYIANSSSGTMGVELVREAWLRGAKVTLVCNQEVLERFQWIRHYAERIILVETTEDAYKEVSKVFDNTDIYISASALCDFENAPLKSKIKKSSTETIIKLKSSVDVFSELSKRKTKQFMVGFALESEAMEENATLKLREKGMDMIVANTVDAIGAKSSRVAIMDKQGIRRYVQEAEKRVIASEILKEIETIMNVNNEERVTNFETCNKHN